MAQKAAKKKAAKKKAARKVAPAAKKRAFRREDIPGIVPRLRDFANPVEVARALGVPITRLRARQILDPGRTPQEMVNEFYVG